MGTHHTKLMEMESIALYFVAKDARVLIHSATEHACWRGENYSSERLVGPAAPGGCPACPRLPSPPLADPQHPSARRRGAACRDTLLSPGSLEPAASCVPAHTVRIDGNHLQSVCPISAGLRPPRDNLGEKRDEAECSAPAPSAGEPSSLGSLRQPLPPCSPHQVALSSA